jgi:GNAT superfamily N-acetyltransferase
LILTDWVIEQFRADHIRSEFACGVSSLDDFLKFHVSRYEQRSLGRTYVAVSSGSNKVSGYYTIVAGSIPFQSMPNDLARKLPRHPIPTVLIARLAVDKESQGHLLGEYLLINSLHRADKLSTDLGIHAVQVDAIDDRAASFYRKYGFVPLEDQPRCLILPVSTIQARGPGT